MISPDRNYLEVTSSSFVLPRLHLNILRAEEMLQFRTKTILDVRGHVIPAQQIKRTTQVLTVIETIFRASAKPRNDFSLNQLVDLSPRPASWPASSCQSDPLRE